MSTSAVRNPIRVAIYGALAGSALPTLLSQQWGAGYNQSIYHEQAPADAGFPFVVFSKSSSVPAYTFGTYVSTTNGTAPGVLENDLWLVKGVVRGDDVLTNTDLGQGESPSDRADRIASRIRTLLNDYTLSISPTNSATSQTAYLRRESDIEYAELADGVVYRHCGALYRLITTNP